MSQSLEYQQLRDLWPQIFTHLDFRSLVMARGVCTNWRDIIKKTCVDMNLQPLSSVSVKHYPFQYSEYSWIRTEVEDPDGLLFLKNELQDKTQYKGFLDRIFLYCWSADPIDNYLDIVIARTTCGIYIALRGDPGSSGYEWCGRSFVRVARSLSELIRAGMSDETRRKLFLVQSKNTKK